MIDSVSADAERHRWTHNAVSWERWAERMTDPAARVNAPLLRLSGVESDSHVLDLAAGVGEPSLTLAALLERGWLVSCDLIPAMLIHLRQRAASRGPLPALAAADMARLPFRDASFDRLFCRFGLMFVPDLSAALVEMRRVLRPGGAAALAVWGPRRDNSLFDQVGSVLDDVMGPDPDDMLSTLFRFADPSTLLRAARESGFKATQVEPLHLVQQARADQPFWLPTLEMGFAHRLAGLSPTDRASLHRTIKDHFARRADGENRVEIRMSIHLLNFQA